MNSIKHFGNQHCRACYSSNNNLQLVTNVAESSSEHADQKTYAQLLSEVCNINILDMPLGQSPQFICFNCSRTLELAQRFIEQTRRIDQWLRSNSNIVMTESGDFIEKPELDIPVEIKVEKDDDDDVNILPTDQVFQYSPNESEIIKAKSTLLTYQFGTPRNDYDVKEIEINKIFENDNESSNELMVPRPIEYKNAYLVIKGDINKSLSKNTNNENNTKLNGNTSLSCIQCNKRFTSIGKLNRHKRFSHIPEENKIPCKLCSQKFSRPDHLNRHIQNVHKTKTKSKGTKCKKNVDISCNVCRKIFSSIKSLTRHKRVLHGPEEEKISCNICGQKFGRNDYLKKHFERIHCIKNA